MTLKSPVPHKTPAKPFLKWPGGKSNLISTFQSFLPEQLYQNEIDDYFEPFVGSGAMFFFIMQNFRLKKACLNDSSKEVIIAYKVIKKDPENLIKYLSRYKERYLSLRQNKRPAFYYNMRDAYNSGRQAMDYRKYSQNWIQRTAQLIFLNKTCFNGLYRFNQKGDFNSPAGRYNNPGIYNEANLMAIHKLLKKTSIVNGDFETIAKKVSRKSFVYLDPPYRPISRTSSFTSYTSKSFDDNEHIRLAEFLKVLHKKGAKFMLSNSEPKDETPDDHFFDRIYDGFTINNVLAARMINCKGNKRGKIREILVTNYSPPGMR
ncbi:DNA adenine methylase [Fibrobacterota bacterium]